MLHISNIYEAWIWWIGSNTAAWKRAILHFHLPFILGYQAWHDRKSYALVVVHEIGRTTTNVWCGILSSGFRLSLTCISWLLPLRLIMCLNRCNHQKSLQKALHSLPFFVHTFLLHLGSPHEWFLMTLAPTKISMMYVMIDYIVNTVSPMTVASSILEENPQMWSSTLCTLHGKHLT